MATINSSHETIEDVILSHDKRGMTGLRPYLSPDFCMQASKFLYERKGTIFIVTGFYEIVPKVIETDGPPGALAVGKALLQIGHKVVYIVDKHGMPFLEPESGGAEVIEFPFTTDEQSKKFASKLLKQYEPSAVLAIERCSVTKSGNYLNMSGQDISAYNAKTDYLFQLHQHTVGVGDGGNEIGMGKLSDIIPTVPNLPQNPAITASTHLVIASVSNWGGYGIAAGLSILEGKDLLNSRDDETDIINRMVERGAVDGMHLTCIPSVDGFTLEENLEILDRLHNVIQLEI